jgi:hypothetical protein
MKKQWNVWEDMQRQESAEEKLVGKPANTEVSSG